MREERGDDGQHNPQDVPARPINQKPQQRRRRSRDDVHDTRRDHHTSALTLTGKDCLVRSVSAAHQTLLNIKVLHDVIEEPLCLNGSIKNL